MGQINCGIGSPNANKLVCEFPIALGTLQDASALGSAGQATIASAQATAQPLNNAVAAQVSQLPLPSASAGVVVLYKNGVPVTYNNLGPILADRAQTIGKGKIFLGGAASQFVFTKIDGVNFSALQWGFSRTASNSTVVYTGESIGENMRINQYLGVLTYGVTNRLDLSAMLPFERISIGSSAGNVTSYMVDANSVFLAGPIAGASSYTVGRASGISDLVINAKFSVYKGDRATVSMALNTRFPTGDDLNLLGSGSYGFNPYVVYSYLAKVSPHLKVGYQWNTKTELNNPTQTSGGNMNLPGGVLYDIGADWSATRKLTYAADLLGSQFVNAPILEETTSTVVTAASGSTPSQTITIPTSVRSVSSYSINSLSAGLKFNPTHGFVMSCNVLFQVNNSGLRTRPTPTIGASYKF